VKAQSYKLGCYYSRVKSRMTAFSPCFYEPVVIRRNFIFRLVFLLLQLSPSLEALLLQFFPSLEAFSFQNLFKTQKWRGWQCWSLLPSSTGGKTRLGLR
jgi:hypothetical protein